MNEMFCEAKLFNQKLCGEEWVNSKASNENMFEGSFGSILQTVCASSPTPHQHKSWQTTHRQKAERELIDRKSINTLPFTSTVDRTIRCTRCGTFRKSGRVSCCAPGGAWFKSCGGGLSSKNVHHRW